MGFGLFRWIDEGVDITCMKHCNPRIANKKGERKCIRTELMFCGSVLQFTNLAFVSHKVVKTSLQCTFVVTLKLVHAWTCIIKRGLQI